MLVCFASCCGSRLDTRCTCNCTSVDKRVCPPHSLSTHGMSIAVHKLSATSTLHDKRRECTSRCSRSTRCTVSSAPTKTTSSGTPAQRSQLLHRAHARVNTSTHQHASPTPHRLLIQNALLLHIASQHAHTQHDDTRELHERPHSKTAPAGKQVDLSHRNTHTHTHERTHELTNPNTPITPPDNS
jgi:hypothetical protein